LQIAGTRGTGDGGLNCPETYISTSVSFTVTLPSQYSNIAEALAAGYVFIGTGTGTGYGHSYSDLSSGGGPACYGYIQRVGPEPFSVFFSQTSFGTEGTTNDFGVAAVGNGTDWTVKATSISYNGGYIQPSSLCVLTCFVGTISFTINGDIACELGLPNSLHSFSAPPLSSDLKNTVMAAWFNPTLGTSNTSLLDAAKTCGYSEFNWQQTVDWHPLPEHFLDCFLPNFPTIVNISACLNTNERPSLPLFTSPPGPTAYQTQFGVYPAAPQSLGDNAWYDPPFSDYTYMWDPTNPDYANFAVSRGAYPFYFNFQAVTSGGQELLGDYLVWSDAPSLGNSSRVGEHKAFTTNLVGVKPTSPPLIPA
jgi:hypothetical protein